MGQDEVHREEGANRHKKWKENEWNDRELTRLHIGVHEVRPAFECAHLERGEECLAEVVETGNAVGDHGVLNNAIHFCRI